MTVTSGFFNSVNHDRKYNAEEISSIFDGIILDGVYQGFGEAFKIEGTSTANQVKIGTGRAWFNHTWTLNDEALYLTLPAPNSTYPRIDAIVLEVNNSSSVRTNTIKYISGTAASSPTKPALTNTTDVHQYPLAYITRPNGDSAISAGNIENAIGTSACPIVTGILEVLSDDRFIAQTIANLTTDFNTWFEGIKDALDGNVAANLLNKINRLDETLSKRIDAIDNYISTMKIIPKQYLGSQITQEQINQLRDGYLYNLGDYWIINGHYYIVVGNNTYTHHSCGYDCRNKNHLVLLYMTTYPNTVTNVWKLTDTMFNSSAKKVSDRYTWYLCGANYRSNTSYNIFMDYIIPFEKQLYPLDVIKNDIINDVGKSNLLKFPMLSNEGITGKTYVSTDMLVITPGDIKLNKMPKVIFNTYYTYYMIDLGNSGLPIEKLYTSFTGNGLTYTTNNDIITEYNNNVIRKRIINMCSGTTNSGKQLTSNSDKIHFGDVSYYLGSTYDADSSSDSYGSYSETKNVSGVYATKSYPMDKITAWNPAMKLSDGVYYTNNTLATTHITGGVRNYNNTASDSFVCYDNGGAALSEFNYNKPLDKSAIRSTDYSVFKCEYNVDQSDSCIPIMICI